MKTTIQTAALVLAMTAGAVQAASCDVDYAIQPGETLSDIAMVAYGSRDYQLIYSRNIAVIASLADLPVGETIVIPCQPGELGLSPDAVALTFRMLSLEAFTSLDPGAGDEAAVELSGPAFLTANVGGLLSGEDLREGGMIPALIARALGRGSGDALNVAYVDDVESHLETLLPSGGFAIGYPWRRPACERASGLPAADRALCENYRFSEAIYATVNGVYALRDRLPAESLGVTALIGARVCAAGADDLGALAGRGLPVGSFAFDVAPSVAACFERVVAGDADIAVAEAFAAETALASGEFGAVLAEAEWLAMPNTLHAIALKDDAEAVAVIEEIDAGLNEMRENGDWFQIVAGYLTTP